MNTGKLFFDEEPIDEILKRLNINLIFCTYRRTDKPKAICPLKFFNVGGIKIMKAHPFSLSRMMTFPKPNDTTLNSFKTSLDHLLANQVSRL